ncbi:hypothetical protein ACFXTN_042533 [Malus domestica]
MRADPWPELKKGLGDFLKDYLDSDLEYESEDPYSRNRVSPGPYPRPSPVVKLLLLTTTEGGNDRKFNTTNHYLYCGSSLNGNLSPQRVKEWIAYHVQLFGPRSHFVIHDAGGILKSVLEVLKP